MCLVCIANGQLAHDVGLRHRDAPGLGDHMKGNRELMKGFTQQTIKTTFAFPKATLATRFIMNWKEVQGGGDGGSDQSRNRCQGRLGETEGAF